MSKYSLQFGDECSITIRYSPDPCPSRNLLTERRVDEDSVVELGGRGSDVNGLHLLEGAERVALGEELLERALVEWARDEEHDVVDHVAVPVCVWAWEEWERGQRLDVRLCIWEPWPHIHDSRDKVEEGGEGLDGLRPHVHELRDRLLPELVVERWDGNWARLVRQKVPVVRPRQMELQV